MICQVTVAVPNHQLDISLLQRSITTTSYEYSFLNPKPTFGR